MTEFVAEIGANHNGSLFRATDLIFAAHSAGCSAVKFQFFGPRGLYADGIKPNPVGFPVRWLPTLRDLTDHFGMRLGCSVFDVDSVAWAAYHVDFLKVSSYSLLDERLLDAVKNTKLPVVLATGMATLDEVDDAIYRFWRSKPTLLHCVSAYPVKATDCHLANIGVLRKMFDADVGWSDHSGDPAVIMRAAGRWRASMIECHLDLSDLAGAESAGGHCWTPESLRAIISDVRQSEIADGVAGKPVAAERPELPWRADPDDGLRPRKSLRSTWTASHTT